MSDRLYRDFYDPTEEFNQEPRAFCYDLSIELINRAKKNNIQSWYVNIETLKAIILLLYCWNFAARKTKDITFKKVHDLILSNENDLRSLEQYTLMTFTEESEQIIRRVYSRFLDTFGQTGATKALSLLNPSLFLMWDTRIRGRLRRELIKGLDNGQTENHYIMFLREVRQYAIVYDFQGRLPTNAILAKKIDEYHYIKIVMKL